MGRQTDCPTYEGIRHTELQIGRWMNDQTDIHIDRLTEGQKRDKKERKKDKQTHEQKEKFGWREMDGVETDGRMRDRLTDNKTRRESNIKVGEQIEGCWTHRQMDKCETRDK
jgi:hypothetical protein